VTKRAPDGTSSARKRRPAAPRKGRRRAAAERTLDLEAVGLVLLAFGIALTAMLVPAFPAGDLGVQVRGVLGGPMGWGAWLLPWPFLILGGLFLLRRSPRAWPRVLAGYAVAGIGTWALTMLVAPEATGAWGAALRGALTGAAGALAYLPAVLLVTLGVELIAGWAPTLVVRRALAALLRGGRTAAKAAWRARARARARAAFRADVARVRRELQELDRDLAALAGLYPASGELARWRASVQEAVAALRGADASKLDVARADVAAWRSAVGDFARDRGAELAHQLRAEGARPPGTDGGDLEGWGRHVKALLDEPLTLVDGGGRARRGDRTPRSVVAGDGVRKGMALDLAALLDRHRRLARERDLAEAGLADARPRDLALALEAHGDRMQALKTIEADALDLQADVDRLDAWRDALDGLVRLRLDHPDDPEVADLDEELAAALRGQGRAELAKHEGWRAALADVASAARARALQAAAAEAAAGAGSGGDPEDVDGAALLGDAELEALIGDDVDPFGDPVLERSSDVDADAPPWTPAPTAAGRGSAAPGAAPSAVAARGADGEPAAVGGIPIQLPQTDLLDPPAPARGDPGAEARELRERVARIDATLSNFKLEGRVVASVRGPSVTRFEVEPAAGEKISRFANLSDDLALAMAVASVRIEAPIPGKSVIGLEVPNADRDLIRFREAVESGSFKRTKARLPLILGKSIDGDVVVGDLARMPHLLIAGSTGSGKSVAVNTLVGSLLYRFLPTELRFLMIDPKMVELTPFDGVKHLIRPVVTNPGEAAGVLLGAVAHMERRYKMMSKIGAKNLDQYNAKAKNLDLPELPFIIIVIDELADLMITSPKEVESAIMRLAQMARATGMHLILATQRPSVDILTSLIKVNVPARMAFAVSSGFDSRTILDAMGAERLIGMGDMLYHQPGIAKPVRLQGPFVSEAEIGAVADFLRRQYFEDEFVEAYGDDFEPASPDDSDATGYVDWNDDKLRIAAEMVINEGQASVSRLQRRLQVGHARAGKLMDSLEALGVVGPHIGSKPREVLIAFEELPNVFGK
jgi:S-DNA-T family DNA segregation ATPase FtsK/SpoIIIE